MHNLEDELSDQSEESTKRSQRAGEKYNYVYIIILSGFSSFNFKKYHRCVLIVVSVGVSSSDPSSDYANYYQGLWDCEADKPDELSFRRGDLIYILSKVSACVYKPPLKSMLSPSFSFILTLSASFYLVH